MMAPDDETESADGHQREDHRLIPENRFTRKHRDDFGNHAHGRQDEDVDLRMPEEPEKVLPEQWLAVVIAREKRRSEIQIKEQHGCSRRKDWNREQQQQGSDQKRPDRQWQPEHFHARRSHVYHGGDVVGRPGDRGQSIDEYADTPQALTRLSTVECSMRRKRRVRSPARGGHPIGRKKAREEDNSRSEKEPKR